MSILINARGVNNNSTSKSTKESIPTTTTYPTMPKISTLPPVIYPSVKITDSRTEKPTEPTQKTTIYVYITNTGEKYHRSGCQYLRKSKHSITLENAIKSGYTPCSKCSPPRLKTNSFTQITVIAFALVVIKYKRRYKLAYPLKLEGK